MKCNICNSDIQPEILFKNKSAQNPDIVRCPVCKITFIHPQPDSKIISDYYNGLYASLAVYDEKKMQDANRSLKAYQKNINKINPTANELLDLGCGLGYYSKAALNAGYSVTSVEQDKVSIKFARDILKLNNIIEKSIEDYILTTELKFDVIFLRHVIEHVTNPRELIEGISGMLKTGGVLVIETDNNAGIELLFRPHSLMFYLQIYKKKYKKVNFLSLIIKRPFAIDYPRHLFAFNMKNLSGLLKTYGMTAKKKVHYQTGHSVYWPNLKTAKRKEILIVLKEFKIKSILNLIIEYSVLPFRIVLRIFGLSAGICIYAKKVDEKE